MALPNSFTAATAATGAQLDENFAAVGALTTISCTVSGTNTLTLAPNADTPSVSVYANYAMFSGVVTNTNTGAVTAAIGGLSALNVYKDGPLGPTVLSGGELIAGNAFSLRYDSALNAGSGGFHLGSSTAVCGGLGQSITLYGSPPASVGTLTGVTLTSALIKGNSLSITGVLASITTLSAVAASVTTLRVGVSSSSISRVISGLGTLSFSVTNASDVQDTTMALAGAQVRDSISLGMGTSIPSGAGFTGWMSAAGTVTIRLTNPTTVTLGAFTTTLRATAMGFT